MSRTRPNPLVLLAGAACAATLTGLAPVALAEEGVRVTRILAFSASRSQINDQQTPVAVRDGHVYTANIEPGPNGDSDDTTLRTVLRQGRPRDDGGMDWTSIDVDGRTAADRYHTAPAVGTDSRGQVHVAYNMHNLPWQYVRTTSPHDIESLAFHGQPISDAEIDRAKFANRTSFPTLGKADIPGNQITYPAFVNDTTGALHVSYRFAARPARSFADRTMSGGTARYDAASESWSALGGEVALSEGDFAPDPEASERALAIASERGWTVYHPDLAFDAGGRMHVQFFWRRGGPGGTFERPCHVVRQSDGSFTDAANRPLRLPLRADDCGNMGFGDDQRFYSSADTAIGPGGVPYVLLSPVGGQRQIMRLDTATGRWLGERSPYAATEIFFAPDGALWAIGSRMRVFRRAPDASSWEFVHSGGGKDCFPRAAVDAERAVAYVHTFSCGGSEVSLYAIEL